MTGRFGGQGTNIHVLLFVRALNSSFKAPSHSGCLIADEKLMGSIGIDDEI